MALPAALHGVLPGLGQGGGGSSSSGGSSNSSSGSSNSGGHRRQLGTTFHIAFLTRYMVLTSICATWAALHGKLRIYKCHCSCQQLATLPAGHNDSQAAHPAQSASSISSTVAMPSSTLTVTLQLLPWRDTSASQKRCQ